MSEPKATSLPSAPKGAQSPDHAAHKSGDPNMAGWADTGSTLDYAAGASEPLTPNSPEHYPFGAPEPTRRDGGERNPERE